MDLASSVREELACPLCFHLFDDPRILACGHTFCLKCLVAVYEENSISAVLQSPEIRCPLCRRPTDFEEGHSIHSLPRNYQLASVIALVAQQEAQAVVTSPSAPSLYPDLNQPVVEPSAPPLEEEQMRHLQATGRAEEMFYTAVAPDPSPAPPLPSSPPALATNPRATAQPPAARPAPAPAPSPSPSPAPLAPVPFPNTARQSVAPNAPRPAVSSTAAPAPAAARPSPSAPSPSAPAPSNARPAQPQPAPQQAPAPPVQPPVRFVQPKIEREHAPKYFFEWKSSLWFAPSGFSDRAVLDRVGLFFVPYWCTDAQVAFRAELEVAKLEHGQTRWQPVVVTHKMSYRHVLTLATHPDSVGHEKLVEITPQWNADEFLPAADADSFGGWLTSTFKKIVGIGPDRGYQPPPDSQTLSARPWAEAFEGVTRPILLKSGNELIAGAITKQYGAGTSTRNLRLNYTLEAHMEQLVNLPVFLCPYSFDTTVFLFIVNGLGGQREGTRPYSAAAKVANGIKAIGSFLFGGKS